MFRFYRQKRYITLLMLMVFVFSMTASASAQPLTLNANLLNVRSGHFISQKKSANPPSSNPSNLAYQPSPITSKPPSNVYDTDLNDYVQEIIKTYSNIEVAVENYGIGKRIFRFEDAKAGDLLIWRDNPYKCLI